MKLIFAKKTFLGSAVIAFVLSAGSLCAEKILYLGDSLSMGSFGRTMDSQMRAAGNEVYTYVTGGATPYYWLGIYDVQKTTIGQWEKTPETEIRKKTATVPKIEDLLQKHWPDIVVVQTGVNLYAQLRSKQRSKKENIREVTMLVRNMGETIKAAGAKCFWITPPDSHVARYPRELQDEMFQIMKLAASRYGPVFNSQEVTTYTDPYPRTDGIHYGSKEANAWGNLVAEEVTAWLSERHGQPARRPLMAAFRAKQLDGPGLASFAGVDTAIPGVELGKNATPVAALVPDAAGVPKGKASKKLGDRKIAASMQKTEDAIAEAKSVAMASAKAERARKDALELEAKKKAAETARAEALALAKKQKKELENAAREKALKLAAAEKRAKAEAEKRAAELAKAEKIAKAEQLARMAAKEKEEAAAKLEAEKLAKEKMIAAAEAMRVAKANAAAKMAEEKKAKAEAEKRIAALAAAEKESLEKAAAEKRIAVLASEKEILEKAAAQRRIAARDAAKEEKPKKAESEKKVVAVKEAPAPDVYKVKRAKPSSAPSDEVDVDIKLVGISKTPSKSQVNYGKAIAIYEWEVVKVNSGTYTPKTIRIAHTVYWNGKPTSTSKWKPGRTWSLNLKVLSAYPQVEQWQTFDDLELNTDLPVYLPKM